MKDFFDTLKLTFSVVGAVCGAGFIGGAEIVRFFGVNAFIPTAIFCFFFTAVSLFICFRAQTSADSLELLNKKLFTMPRTFYALIMLASLLVSAASLSAIRELVNGFLPTKISVWGAVFSALFLIPATLILKRGFSIVEKVNVVIVPLLIALTVVVCLKRGGEYEAHTQSSIKDVLLALLYAFSCCFMNLPVIFDSAKGKGVKTHVFAAVFSTALIAVLAVIIAATIKGAGTAELSLPLSFAVGDSPLFKSAFFVAVITSLFCAYYPLCTAAEKSFGWYGKLLLAVTTFSLSLFGIKFIAEVFYPLLGGLGAIFVFKSAAHILSPYKKHDKVNNNGYRGGFFMRKKKNKVAKLSEEDYNKYIMALKDEKPPVAVRKAQKD